MPVIMASAQPVPDFDVLFAYFAFANFIKVIKLERLISTKLICFAMWA